MADVMTSHFALNGDIGSGKTSVATLLSRSCGRPVISAGDVLRKLAAERGITALEANYMAERDDSVDAEINRILVDHACSGSSLIYDSRIAWYLIPDSFKVHLTVDPEVAARRLQVGRASVVEAYLSVEDARQAIEKRYQSERRRFFRQHGVDITQHSHYDLVMDTSDMSADSVAAQLESAWMQWNSAVLPPSRGPLSQGFAAAELRR